MGNEIDDFLDSPLDEFLDAPAQPGQGKSLRERPKSKVASPNEAAIGSISKILKHLFLSPSGQSPITSESLARSAVSTATGIREGLGDEEAPTEDMFRRVGQVVGEETLPGAGMIVGGRLGGYKGAGVGAALGQTGKQIAGKALGARPRESPLGDIAFAGAEGVGAELLGLGTGKFITGVAAPFASKVGAAGLSLLETAKKYGINLSPSDITKSKILSTIESLLEKTPLGSETIDQYRNKAINALRLAKAELKNKIGRADEAEVIGLKLKEVLAAGSKEFNAKSTELYGEVGKIVPPDTLILTDRLKQTAMALLKREEKLPVNTRDNKVIGVLRDMTNLDEGGLTKSGLVGPSGEPLKMPGRSSWETLSTLRSQLGQFIADQDAAVKAGIPALKFQGTRSGGIYKMLRKAVDADLNTFATTTGGEVKKAFDLANAFYKEGKQIFDSKTIRRITNLNPERVANFVIRPGNVTEIKIIKKAIGEKGFEPIKRAFTEKLLSEPLEGAAFAPMRLVRHLDKYGDETLRQVFSPQELTSFRELGRISANMQSAERLAGNPSGTGRTMITFITGGAVFTDPVTGGVALISPALLSKLYTSDFGRRWLTTGLRVPPGAKQSAELGAKISGFLGLRKLLQPRSALDKELEE